MDPISLTIELELATLIIAGIGAFMAWTHNKHQKARFNQRERHHRETLMVLHTEEQQNRRKLQALHDEDCPPSAKVTRRSR